MIQLHNVSLGYTAHPTLSELTHTFAPEKISVIIGENGVGKSTLIKAITNQLKPLSGSITLNDAPLTSYTTQQLAQQIAYLPQNPLTPEDMTVYQLCIASRFPYRKRWRSYTAEDKMIVRETLELLGLEQYTDTPLHLLSGGLRQRAWFAMILAQQTDILILDEPTSFLDVAYQLELLELLQKLNKTLKKTIIMILHDINHALRYADEIIALRKDNTPIVTTPADVSPDFFQQTLHIDTHITHDPVFSKPFAIPLNNTIKKAP